MWIKSITTVALLVTAGNALAGHKGDTSYVYARVVDVEPIVRYVTVDRPRQECWEELVPERNPRPFGVAGQTLAGGVIGAAIGRQFGSGSGRDAMTLIGSFVGSAVAHERAERVREYQRDGYTRMVAVQRCEVVNERYTQERVDAYRVTYQYQGRRHTIRTHEPPGERIRLKVNVVPVGF